MYIQLLNNSVTLHHIVYV